MKKIELIILAILFYQVFVLLNRTLLMKYLMSLGANNSNLKITLTDNSVLIGKILRQSDSITVFKSSSGLMVEIKPEFIKETEVLKGEIQDENMFVTIPVVQDCSFHQQQGHQKQAVDIFQCTNFLISLFEYQRLIFLC